MVTCGRVKPVSKHKIHSRPQRMKFVQIHLDSLIRGGRQEACRYVLLCCENSTSSHAAGGSEQQCPWAGFFSHGWERMPETGKGREEGRNE